MTFASDSTIIAGSRAMPSISVTNGGETVPSPHFQLSSSDTTILGIAGDSLVGRRLGDAVLTATLESSLFPAAGPRLVQKIRVVPKRIVVAPMVVRFQAVGDTLSLTVSATDVNDVPISSVPVIWTSLDDAIVRVSGARLTAMRADSTDVRAIVGRDTVRVPVIVKQRVASYRFAASVMVLDAIGAETTLVVTGRDPNGNVIPNAPLPLWESSDTTRATVSVAGVLRAVANADASLKVHVRARRPDGADSMLVVIDQVARRVVITPQTGTTISSLGGSIRLGAFAYDRLGQNVLDGPPHWESRQPGVARPDTSQGTSVPVVGLDTGRAWILARVDAAADSVEVSVLNEPGSIDVAPSDTVLRSAGDTLSLRPRVFNGEGALIANATLTWATPDPAIVQLLPNGVVLALDSGRARVIGRVVTATRTLADTAIVNVTNAPALIRMLRTSDTLVYLGDTATTPVRIENARGGVLPPTRVRWTSSAPLIATSDPTGRVTARAVGTTWIIAAGDPPGARDSIQIVVTNLASSITIDSHVAGAIDTIPAPGKTLPYTATVRGASGAPVSGFTQQWTSSAPTVATVGQDGVVTATGYGTSLITVRAANVFDTVRVVIRRPSKIFIDGGRAGAIAFGTYARPLPTINSGLAMAQPGDTLFVAPGAAYVETLSSARAITILGDSSAFLASARDPLKLPQLVNNSAAPAISASGGAFTLGHLVVRNNSDDAAIRVVGVDVTINAVHVNPGAGARPRGAGIIVTGAPAVVIIDSSTVEGTVGTGIRVEGSAGVRLTRNRITVVRRSDAALESGSGIFVAGGSSPLVSANTVRTADGIAILVSQSSAASLVSNTLRGERQLMLLNGVSGMTSVNGNSFELSRPADEPFTGNSTTDGRSGLEVRGSAGVQITSNFFHDGAAATSLMDAIHLVDARSARLDKNRVIGGRRAIVSDRSSWDMLRSRADSVALTIETSGSDTLSLTDDTLSAAGTGCIAARNGELTLMRVTLSECGVGDLPALGVIGGALSADLVVIGGTNPRAIVVDSARRASVRRSTVRGPNAATVGIAGNGGIDITADSAIVTNTFVTGYPDRAGISLTGGVVRADSNTVNRSRTGISVEQARVSLDIRDDDLYDADTAALSVISATAVNAPGVWWGDGRGPRGTSAATVGDTAVGPIVTSPYRGAPLRSGITATRMRKLGGDNQVAPQQTTLPRAFSVRVTDADGLPVKNKTVTFALPASSSSNLGGGQKTVNVITNVSGIAEATLRLGRNPSNNTVTVTATGVSDVLVFTSTAQ